MFYGSSLEIQTYWVCTAYSDKLVGAETHASHLRPVIHNILINVCSLDSNCTPHHRKADIYSIILALRQSAEFGIKEIFKLCADFL